MNPLEIWVPAHLLLKNQRPCPLLMHLSEPDTEPQLLFWNQLREILPKVVQVNFFNDLGEVAKNGVVVMPHDAKEWLAHGQFNQVRRYVRHILATGRTVVTFALGIEYEPLPGELAFITSAYRSKREKALPLPSWLFDIGSEVTSIGKPAVPSVTFMGNTKYHGRIGVVLNRLPLPHRLMAHLTSNRAVGRALPLNCRFALARWLRRKAVNVTRNASQLKTHLVELDNYFVYSEEERKKLRADFLRSIRENAYALCMRGDANGDYRTYEILSAGRIPVIVDTNLWFPDLEGLSWQDFCVFVPVAELDSIGQKVAAFHERTTEESFQAKCQMAREAFEQLMPHRYIRHIVRQIEQRVAIQNADAQATRQLVAH